MKDLEYHVVIAPLPPADGGGFVATVPDLAGCMSVANVRDAIAEWIETAKGLGRQIPAPTSYKLAG
jgi:antitoxin HicB